MGFIEEQNKFTAFNKEKFFFFFQVVSSYFSEFPQHNICSFVAKPLIVEKQISGLYKDVGIVGKGFVCYKLIANMLSLLGSPVETSVVYIFSAFCFL